MKALLACFGSADDVTAAAEKARHAGFPVLDALTPFQLPSLDGVVAGSAPRIRGPMALAGFGVAAFAFGFQWWSAVLAYPFNSGGRPLFSWPVFLLVPFEVGVLAAAVAGLVALLFGAGLPRLNHPVFDVPGIERATQDRFFLVLDPLDDTASAGLKRLLFGAGALSVSETDT